MTNGPNHALQRPLRGGGKAEAGSSGRDSCAGRCAWVRYAAKPEVRCHDKGIRRQA